MAVTASLPSPASRGKRPIKSTKIGPTMPESPAAAKTAPFEAVANKERADPSLVDKLTRAECGVK